MFDFEPRELLCLTVLHAPCSGWLYRSTLKLVTAANTNNTNTIPHHTTPHHTTINSPQQKFGLFHFRMFFFNIDCNKKPTGIKAKKER